MSIATTKNWAVPAFNGILYAIISIIFFAYAANGLHRFSAIIFLGELTTAAGACTIAAGLWNSARRASWPLMLNGIVCTALGWMLTFWRGPIAFRTIALLIVGMATSLAVHEFLALRSARRQALENWLPGAAGIVSLGFALVFLAFALRLIPLFPSPSAQTFLWLGSFFAFSAICMLQMTLRSTWLPVPALRERIT